LSGLHKGQSVTIFTPGKVSTVILLLAYENDDVFEKEDSSCFATSGTFWIEVQTEVPHHSVSR